MTLAELDDAIRAAQGAGRVTRLDIEENGVDPIGLRQLNLDMMDAVIPGINNVTVNIRPYAYMAWAWERARIVLNRDSDTHSNEIIDLVARYEAFYAWAHSLAGRPLAGATAVRKHLPRRDAPDRFTFAGPEWEAFKRSRLSFMDATRYGPSIKSLRVLKPHGAAGMFEACTEYAEAVAEIGRAVERSLPARLVAREAPTVGWEEVLPLAEALPIDAPSEAERRAFRLLFFEGDDNVVMKDIRRRRATVELIRSVLPEDGEISVPEIRRRLAAGGGARSSRADDPEIEVSAGLETILQARQLQRQAIEAMMVWLDRALPKRMADVDARAKSTEELAAQAEFDCGEASTSVGAFVDKVGALSGELGWPAAAETPGTDVVALMDRLSVAQRKDVKAVPKLALLAIGIVYWMTKACASRGGDRTASDFIEARPDRLPMGLMAKRIEILRDRPLKALWVEVIERWVIAQHVHWSSARGGDGKQRLRIGLEGGGWIRVGQRAINDFRPTRDRLETLLALGAECGLFRRGSGVDVTYGRQGTFRRTSQVLAAPGDH